ncbi:MAG: ABC transporter substrate-binding protein [Deltaproteobacteria bacterium]|nr:ABC transporter substrate-binding protein [Deltaproteobacteria bacterium]MBW2284374.1 ABC transporter substrate-binding protein [Deltaproteobacteria bacterium]
MRRKKKLAGLMGVFFLFLALAAMPAPAGAEKSATWLSIGPLTGPGAGAVLPMTLGNADYVKEINARGGVDGVKINFVPVDSRYDVARGISIYQRYRKTPRMLVVYTAKTGLAKALGPLINRDRHINFISGAGFAQAKIGRAFLMLGVYQDIFGAALDWMVEDWNKKGKPGKPTVGYLSWEGAYGKQALNGGTQYAEKLGVKLLPPEFYPTGSLKHDTWLNRLAKEGANYIYIGGVDPSQTNVIRDAHALGLTEKIQMVSAEWGLMSTVGVSKYPRELEGSVVVTPQLRGVERLKHPMAKLWTKYRKKPLEDMNPFYLGGIATGMVVEEGLKIALKQVGYKKIGGDAMLKAFEQLKGRDVGQGITGICDYSPTSRLGTKQVRVYRVKGGTVVPITDWIMAPDCVKLGKF